MDIREPLFGRHHQHHLHVRYDNVLHHPDFIPSQYTQHSLPPLPPPPPPLPPHLAPRHILPTPPPPPPIMHTPRHIEHPSLTPRFAFSPPHHPIVDRSPLYGVDLPPKPYLHHDIRPPTHLPPPPPLPPPREDIPLRSIHDYPERNPTFRTEMIRQGFRDEYIHEFPGNLDRGLRGGGSEIHTNIGDSERYHDNFHQSRELYNRRDDNERWDNGTDHWGRNLYRERDQYERRWDNGIHDKGHELYKRRDSDEKRWDNGIHDQGHELYKRRDSDERRWDTGSHDKGHELYNRRCYDERRWDSNSNKQGPELFNRRYYDDRRWDTAINEQGHEKYNDRNYEGRSWDDGINDLRHREGNDSKRRCHSGTNGGVFLRLENRQKEFVEDGLSLGRFNGRLGRRVAEEEFIISKNKKRRVQKNNALNMIQGGKDCIRHSGDYQFQHSSKEFSRGSFKASEQDISEGLRTRLKGMREREQTPMELDISFKSNALIAKAIFTPSRPYLKSDVSSTDVNNNILNSTSGPSPTQSSKDMIEMAVLASGLDLPSNPQGISKELLDEVVVSGSRSVTTNSANGVGVKNGPLEKINLRSTTNGRARRKRLRKKKNRKQLFCQTNLQMKNGTGDTSNANACISIPSAVVKLNSDTTLLKGNSSSAIIGVVPHAGLLTSLGCIVSDEGETSYDSCKAAPPTLSSSPDVADKVIRESSGHAEKHVDTDHACKLRIDDDIHHLRETVSANGGAGKGGSLDINLHANTIDNCNRASVLNVDNSADDITKHCLQDGLLWEKEPSRVIITVEGHDIACSSKPQEDDMPEVQGDKCISEMHESNSFSGSVNALLQKPDNVILSNMFSDANSEEVLPYKVNIPGVGLISEEFRRSEDADAADCSGISLSNSTSSNFLSADHNEVIAEFGISSLDASGNNSFADGANLSHNTDSVEGSPESISPVKHCFSIDYSPKVTRKRRGAQTGLSASNTSMVMDSVRSISGEVSRFLAEDHVPDVELDFHGAKGSCTELGSSTESPHEIKDSTNEGGYGANGSFHGYKKRKFVSPRSNLSSFLEDEKVLDGITSHCAKLDQDLTGLAEQREDIAPASTSINRFGFADVDEKVSSDNFYVGDRDKTVADDPPFIEHHLYLADRDDVFASNSGDDYSDMSSPEDLLSHTDFNFPRDTMASPCQSENGRICRIHNISNRMLVSADPNALFLGKSLEKASSDNSQTNAEILPSLPEDNTEVVKQLNLAHGKLTLSKNHLTYAGPKVVPGHRPQNFSNSRKLLSAPVTKSKTWHRTANNSVAVTESKLQPRPPPESNGKKDGTARNSYIRKGNSLVRKPPVSGVTLPGIYGASSSVYRLNAGTDNLKSNQASDSKNCDPDCPTLPREQVNTSERSKPLPLKGNSLVRKPSVAGVTLPGICGASSSVYRLNAGTDNLKSNQASDSKNCDPDCPALPREQVNTSERSKPLPLKGNRLVRKPSVAGVTLPGIYGAGSTVYRLNAGTDNLRSNQASDSKTCDADCPTLPREQVNTSEISKPLPLKGNSLVRKPSVFGVTLPGIYGSSSSVYRLNACTDNLKGNQASDSKTCDPNCPTLPRKQVNTSEGSKSLPLNHGEKSLSCTVSNLGDSVPVVNPSSKGSPCQTSDALEESKKSPLVPGCRTDSVINSDSSNMPEQGNVRKNIMYVKRRSNQLVAASNSGDTSILEVDGTQASVCGGYYKSKKHQLLRAAPEKHVKKEDGNVKSCGLVPDTIIPGTSTRRRSLAKTYRHLKKSSVWKLHETQSSVKHKNSVRPQKVWPQLLPWKKSTYRKSFMHVLGTMTRRNSSPVSQKLLHSRKRGAIYTRSIYGYSLKMAKVLSVGGTSLKWSKSIERNSVKVNEEATRAVAAAEKRKKEEKGAVSTASKSRNHVSRERIFRIGSERYKMDSTRRALHRITAAEHEPSSSDASQPEKNVKRSYVPKRLLIGNEEYVRIGNGNQLVRDPKKRARILASEKVRWSLRTARLRFAKKRKYCQFFTRFGRCNKEDGKCEYIHDPAKIVVCTKFLNGSCSNPNCKLTHKVIPERMQDCSYFLKGSCSNENCPYRHVHVDPDAAVCESFLRGYCADGNECLKKHTYVCPAFESTGTCPQAATCKLHHPKKKTEKKPTTEPKIVRGRYFDGGLIDDTDCSMTTMEKVSSKGKDEGLFPDYISLDASDDEEMDHITSEQ